MKSLSRFIGVLFLCVTLSCDRSAPTDPSSGPGTISLLVAGTFETTNALVLSVSGGPISNVRGANGYTAVQVSGATGNTRILVMGTIVSGAVVELDVPDISRQYTAEVLDAAGGQATGYRSNALSSYLVSAEFIPNR